MAIFQKLKQKSPALPQENEVKSNAQNPMDAKLHFGYDPDSEFKERGNLFSAIQFTNAVQNVTDSSEEPLSDKGLISNFIKSLFNVFEDKPAIVSYQSEASSQNAQGFAVGLLQGESAIRSSSDLLNQIQSGGIEQSGPLSTGLQGVVANNEDINFSSVAAQLKTPISIGGGDNNLGAPDSSMPISSPPVGNPPNGGGSTGGQPNGPPSLTLSPSSGDEGASISIGIQIGYAGSASDLTIEISNIPSGASLSAGHNLGNGNWGLTYNELTGLQLLPEANWNGILNLQVTATANENGASVSTTGNVSVTILPVASMPVLSIQAASGFENVPVDLSIMVASSDINGSLSIVISNLPTGGNLSAGINNGNGTWTLTPLELIGLKFIPPLDFSGDLNLHISATSTEGGSQATSSASLDVHLSGVASVPVLAVQNSSGFEDQPVSLNINAHTADSGETLSIVIGSIPSGAILSAGINNGNGTWSLTQAQLANLTITPPANYSGQINLTVTAISSEDGTSAQAQSAIQVTVAGVADVPNISASSDAGIENMPVALHISASLNDNDGSEALIITVNGVPSGATLSAGTNDGNGSWTLLPPDLVNLTLNPPQGFSGSFNLSISATSSEGGSYATISIPSVDVYIEGTASLPDLMVSDSTGVEGMPIALSISAALTDNDGSETLSVIINHVPIGAVLSAGIDNGDGSWTLTSQQLMGLTLTPSTNYYGTLHLDVEAISTEGGSTNINSANLDVTVTPIAHAPTLIVTPAAGVEDNDVTLNISATAFNHAQSVSVTIGNLPPGATLSAGMNNGDGTWALTTAELAGLKLIPGVDWNGALDLSVSATSSVNGSDATVSTVLPLSVSGVADKPILTVSDSSGAEDTQIALYISAAPDSQTGSEAISIIIGNVPSGAVISAGINNGDGTWTLSTAQLTNLTITPPTNYSGHINLDVTAIAYEGGTSATTSSSIDVSVSGVADMPTLSVQAASGNEGSPIALNISAGLVDTDGSETLSVVIGNIPNGGTLSAGINNGDGTWTLSAAQLTSLTIMPPPYESGALNLSVIAISSEGGTSVQTPPVLLPVTIMPVASAPILNVNASVSGNEDTAIALNISAALVDTNETLSIVVSGVPVGAVLSAGNNNGNGIWTLTPVELANLSITPPTNYSGDFTLSISAISQDGAISAHTDASINVHVTGVADVPNLSVQAVAGLEGSAIALNISSSLVDSDGSETLSIMIGNVPNGAILSAGINNGNGTWALTSAQLTNLSITPPPYESGTLNLTVQAIASEDGTTAQTLPVPLVVTIIPVADAPVLNVGASISGNEDTAIALNISAALVDINEMLLIIVSGVPTGATLSAGTDNGSGTWTLTSAQLMNLSIMPPTNYSGDFTLAVSAISKDGTSTAHTDASINVHVSGVADVPNLAVYAGGGIAGDPIDLHINASLMDADGSETLFIVIGNVPNGAILSAGTNNGDGTWTLTPSQLANLSITTALTYSGLLNLTVTATASENGTSASTSPIGMPISVGGIADVPILNVQAASGLEDNAIPLVINAGLTDNSGAEILIIEITGVPFGALLSAGNNNGNGSWTLTQAQLSNLTITPPANYSGNFDLTVKAISIEGATQAEVDSTLVISVSAVADAPNLSIQAASGIESSTINLNISAALTDTDGSEALSIIISNVPNGAILSAGMNNGDGTWTLTAAQLTNLSITPVAHMSGLMNLGVTAIASENGTTAQTTLSLPITISAVADAPNLSVQASIAGVEDTALALPILSSLIDTDGSEILSIVVSGVPLGAVLSSGTNNHDGTWALTSLQLTNLTITPPLNFSGNFTLLVSAISIDGASIAHTDASVNVSISGVADAPNLSVHSAFGNEGSAINLSIGAALIDTDGSETLSIIIGNVPSGAILSAGTNNGNGTWTLSAAQLNNLSITPAAHMSGAINLIVTAIASEAGTTAHTTLSLPVTVNPVADVPILSVTASVTGLEDMALSLPMSAGLVDVDGSETLSVVIGGVPVGAVLSAGTNNGNGSWTLTATQLTNLTITPPVNYSGDFTLSVSAIASEGGLTSHTDASINVHISGVADKPILSVTAATGLENTPIVLNIAAALIDTDGSEILSIMVSGVPAGAVLSAGLYTGNGTWVLTPAQLSGLTMAPPNNYNGTFALTVVALSTEGASSDSISVSLPVTVAGVASTPILNVVAAAAGLEDTSIALNISSSLNDFSEILSVVITGMPLGASLNHGLYVGNGKWSLSASDLNNLTITPPVNYSGTIGLTVTAVSTETNGAHSNVSVPLNVTVMAVADAPILLTGTIRGNEDAAIALNIAAGLKDTDGSEVLTALISGVPAGATLSAGANLGLGVWSLTAAELTNLKVTPPANSDTDFTLTVAVTSRETSNNTTATTTSNMLVVVDAVADKPIVSASNVVAVGSQANLAISGTLTDTDGSETITYVIHGMPDGFALNKGINNGDNTWSLKALDLTGLKLIGPEQFNGQLNLNVTSVSHENAGGYSISNPASFYARFGNYSSGYLVDLGVGVNIGGIGLGVQVGALPPIDLLPATGGILGTAGIYAKEDTSFLIADAPGLLGVPLLSAVLGLVSKIEFRGIPSGVTFSAGTNKGGGVWEFTSSQLNNLYMNVPANSDADFTILAVARMLGGLADIGLVSTPVHVMGVADMPNLTASVGAAVEDTAIVLNIAGSLNDTDGSETLSYLVSGMPGGFKLNKGIENGNGTWSLTSSDLTGLVVIPAAHFSGNANLTISAIATEREGDQLVKQQTVAFNITAATDAPIIAVLPVQHTNEDTVLNLNLGISLRDTDGSETISAVTISGLPAGASLTGATNNGNGTWSADVAHLDQVQLVPPVNWSGDFNLSITATSKEISTGLTSSTTSSLAIHIEPVADVPMTTATNSTGDMDHPIALHIGAVLADTDGSESLTVLISGVPDHAMLSSGINNGDGTWTLTGTQLSSLTITPPEGFMGDVALSMTAYSRDGMSSMASSQQSFTVHVTAPPAAAMLMAFSGSVDVFDHQSGWVGNDNLTSSSPEEPNFFTDASVVQNTGSDHDLVFQSHSSA